jgi:outer membrane receptor protein involved in Fe transport
MKASLTLLLIVITLFNNILAQTGKITGKVINAKSGQPLSGATLVLVEKAKTKTADQNGDFYFSKLDAGTYSIKCSYTGFQEKIIEEIIVKDNDNTDITISLNVKLATNDVVITGEKRVKAAGETVSSLLIAQKSSANVSDGITLESIKKTPDKNVGDVITRVSGASVQEGRFAVIRGLNDRYNASFINAAPLPSTESDRKAFSFDIFPSSILDNLIIYKTATPDKTGEFAGGIIDIATKSTVTKNVGSITIGQSYNTLITGKNRFFSETKGKRDWLGLDDGTRALPNALPSKAVLKSYSFDEQLKTAKLFEKYKWGVKSTNTRPNFNFQFSKGFAIERKEKEFLAAIFSINYNRSFTFVTGERNSYDPPDPTAPPTSPAAFPIQRGKYVDSIYNEEIVWAALGNISLKINGKNSISWKNNLSVNTDNKLIKRIGAFDFDSDPLSFAKETVRWYTSDKIYTTQLIGEHQVGTKKTKINWLAAYSKVNREIPNLSRTAYTGSYPDVTNLTPTFGSGLAQFGGNGTMFFTNSSENIKNLKTDITQPYTFMKNKQNFLKIGAGYQFRERDFTSRLLGHIKYTGTTYQEDVSIAKLPEDQQFLGQYLGVLANGKAGISIGDGTLPNADYLASSTTTHAYIMNDQRFFKKFRLIYGVRMEQFNQKLKAAKSISDSINLNTTVTDFLPSANFVYSLTDKTNIRLSYAETLNRPEFRELAPFVFYEYVTGFNISGDETLKRSRIKNYDFRYELFPGKAQLLSFSTFYKQFTNPIEFVLLPNTTGSAGYSNNPSAYVYGVEAEFRVLLSTLFGIKKEHRLLSKFTLTGNAAYMKSKVTLGSIGGISADQLGSNRPLQGQSPYILNGSLGYNNEQLGLSSTLSVNRIGDRLAIGGPILLPDIYEKARTVIDFQIAKLFWKNKVEFKINIRDLLAQNIRTYFDYDKTKSYTEKDRIFSSTIAPKVFSFSVNCKF